MIFFNTWIFFTLSLVLCSFETFSAEGKIEVEHVIVGSDESTHEVTTWTDAYPNRSIRYLDMSGEQRDQYKFAPNLSADITIIDNQPSTFTFFTDTQIDNIKFAHQGVKLTVNGHSLTLLGNGVANSTFVFTDNNSGSSNRGFSDLAELFNTTIPGSGDELTTGATGCVITASGLSDCNVEVGQAGTAVVTFTDDSEEIHCSFHQFKILNATSSDSIGIELYCNDSTEPARCYPASLRISSSAAIDLRCQGNSAAF